MNVSLTTAWYFLTNSEDSKLVGPTRSRRRTADKHFFDTEYKKVLAKVIYDKDTGGWAMIVGKEYLDVITTN